MICLCAVFDDYKCLVVVDCNTDAERYGRFRFSECHGDTGTGRRVVGIIVSHDDKFSCAYIAIDLCLGNVIGDVDSECSCCLDRLALGLVCLSAISLSACDIR